MRTPYALSARASRPGWLAVLCAVIAVLCLGYVIPVAVIDSVMGSKGYWNLLGSISTTLAFHFMYQALLVHTSSEEYRGYRLMLTFVIAAYTGLFLLIHDVNTSVNSIEGFISATIGQVQALLYLGLYLATISAISWSSILLLLRSRRSQKIFVAGFVLVISGNVMELMSLWLQHVEGRNSAPASGLHSMYTGVFFSGVILLCFGFLRASIKSVVDYLGFLYFAAASHVILVKLLSIPTRASHLLRDPRAVGYRNLIWIHDHCTFTLQELGSREASLLDSMWQWHASRTPSDQDLDRVRPRSKGEQDF
ncbi:hypothetical protein ACFRJ9_21675 [Paenarthrobacter sp. NPDC056912]|uniref:hypothetical protein n=1 Tax=Paenarthrobacter sp. NPDC056912 TaxID=3345965 RepID=UPI00366A86E6